MDKQTQKTLTLMSESESDNCLLVYRYKICGQTDKKLTDLCGQTDTKIIDICGQTDTKIIDKCGQTDTKNIDIDIGQRKSELLISI